MDTYFYQYCNVLSISKKNELLKHIYDIGVINGLIYHPQQIINCLRKPLTFHKFTCKTIPRIIHSLF